MTDISGVDDRVIARILKIKALAEDARGNEHEAANAAAMMQELLAQYNLSMAEIDGATVKQKSTGDDPLAKREQTKHGAAAMYNYQRALMTALAHNNFCMYWIREGFKPDPRGRRQGKDEAGNWVNGRLVKYHLLLGRQVNVVVTREMYDYLVDTMDRLLPWTGMEKRGKNALAWLDGCTDRLVERLAQKREEMRRADEARQQEAEVAARHPGAAPGTALATLDQIYGNEHDLNEDFIMGLEPGTTARNRRESEAKQVATYAREAELIAGGMDPGEAWYVARGYDVPKADTPTDETPGERKKREAREQREREAFWARSARRQAREQHRRSDPAFQLGACTADQIGLDDQIDQNKRKGIR